MPHVMIETGSVDLGTILQAVRTATAGNEFSIERLPAERTHELEYEPAVISWQELERELASGQSSSIRVTCKSPALNWVLVYAPLFDDEGLPWWSTVIELRSSEYAGVFNSVKALPGILYVVASSEDTLDLDAESITIARFPWDDDRLIRAAVREKATDAWVERSGPRASIRS